MKRVLWPATSPRFGRNRIVGVAIGRDLLLPLRVMAMTLSVLAVGFSYFGRRLELVHFQPGGASFDTLIRPAFLWLFIVGLLLALRWEIAGAAVAAFAAAGIVSFATNLLIAPHALLTVGAFAAPALLWLVIDLVEFGPRQAMFGLLAVVAAAGAGYGLGYHAYDRALGPTHPEASTGSRLDGPTEWIWTGGATATGIEIRAKFREEFSESRLMLATTSTFADPSWLPGEQLPGFGIVTYTGQDLESNRTYHYAPEIDGEVDFSAAGSFTTFPDGPSSFTVAFGACARVGSNGQVFAAIQDLDPLLYGIIGDFHYGDNDIDSIERYYEVLDLTLTRPAQAALYRSTPVAYVWDDHDYGANNSDGESFARAAAMAGYRQYVPSYELAGPFSAVYQAFTIGRVRFVFTDARATRDASDLPDNADKSMLGQEQKAWLKRELLQASQTHALVVWVNPVPWVMEADDGADSWAGYAAERRELADHIADNSITNLIMVSGDAHMVAIDDGTNTDYSSAGGHGGFPLLHVAALDRNGGIKGGPYSEGAIPGGGQFGVLEIFDDGAAIEVELSGRNWQGEILLSHRFAVPEAPAG